MGLLKPRRAGDIMGSSVNSHPDLFSNSNFDYDDVIGTCYYRGVAPLEPNNGSIATPKSTAARQTGFFGRVLTYFRTQKVPTYKTDYTNAERTLATPDIGTGGWEPPRPDMDHPQRHSIHWNNGNMVSYEAWTWTEPIRGYFVDLAVRNPELLQIYMNHNAAGGRLGGLQANPLGNRGNLPRGQQEDTMETMQPGYGIGGYY